MKRIWTVILVVLLLLWVGYYANQKLKARYGVGLGKLEPPHIPPKVKIQFSNKQMARDRVKITSSGDAHEVLKNIWSDEIEIREEMVVLMLNRSNHVLGFHLLSAGGITGTVADIRLIFSTALNSLATQIILAHNHPSGATVPSEADRSITGKIKKAGDILEIRLIDHLIVTKDAYYSFADEGIL